MLVAVEAAAPFEGVHQQERVAVGPPVSDSGRSLQSDIEVRALAGREVPDAGAIVALPLVREREPCVTGDRRPALRVERQPLVEEVSDDRAGPRIDDPQRRMDQVAVLGVLVTEQRTVARQRAAQEAAVVVPTEPHGVAGAMELMRASAVERYVDGEAVSIGGRRDDDSRSLREALVPAVRDAVEERSRLASEERLREPLAGLVAGLVLEPEHAFAVEARNRVDQPDWMVRYLAARAGVRRPVCEPASCRTRSTCRPRVQEPPATTPGGTTGVRGSAAPTEACSSRRGYQGPV